MNLYHDDLSQLNMPNGWELSRPRVKQRAQQPKTRHITKTGSNGILDQAVGYMRLLGGGVVLDML